MTRRACGSGSPIAHMAAARFRRMLPPGPGRLHAPPRSRVPVRGPPPKKIPMIREPIRRARHTRMMQGELGSDMALAAGVARAERGVVDDAALAAWVDAHAARLYRAAALLAAEAEAADLVQEVFLVASRRRAAFDGSAAPYTWLYGILRNLARDRRRKQARRARLRPVDDRRSRDPERLLAAERDRARVRAAVRRLPDGHREVVALYYLDELPVAEVARRLGVPPGTVKSRLFKARAALRRALEGGR